MGYKTITYERTCLECGITLNGRSDQKYCSITCKNLFNNKKKYLFNRYKYYITTQISRNYKLLETMINEEIDSATMIDLKSQGFDDTVCTGYMMNKHHKEILCYDIAYNISSQRIFGVHRVGIDIPLPQFE